MAAAVERGKAAVRKFQEQGIIDSQGRRIRTDLPADDRAAELNGGSYIGIFNEIRKIVNGEFEAFTLGCIERGVSFAIETTLRSDVTFRQAHMAKQTGFVVEMRYLALRAIPPASGAR